LTRGAARPGDGAALVGYDNDGTSSRPPIATAAPGRAFGARRARDFEGEDAMDAEARRVTMPQVAARAPAQRLDAVFDQRRDLDKVFHVALRHSRRVRLLRIAVPMVAILAILAPLLFSAIRSLSLTIPLGDLGRLVLSGDKLTMEAPRLAGFTKENRAYKVTAKRAQQDITHPFVVDLEDIQASIELADHGQVEMSAEHGLLDAKTELLTLSRAIFIRSSEGYEGRLLEALINIKAGTVVSRLPVQLKFLQGDLRADSMDLSNKDQVARFQGNVVMNVKLPQSTATPAADAGARP
jgi:lipopolysaccharide export system protein LptC